MVWLRAVLVSTCLLFSLAQLGCESDPESDSFQVRVRNGSAAPVLVYIDGALLREVPPGEGASIDLSDRAHVVSLQRPDGSVLFEQRIDIGDGVFVRYDVAADGSVTATGDTRDADVEFESSRRQVRVLNDFPEPIFVFIDEEYQADVAAGKGRTIGITRGAHRVSLRQLEGRVLFGQTIQVVEGTYVRYQVATDGAVTASGGAI
jgi:hypothetical protein